MDKDVYVKMSDEALPVYEYITKRAFSSKSEKIMLTALLRKIEQIKNNPHCGQALAKKLIPKEYKEKYQVENLYRLELPFFWRMLYTLKDNRVEIIAFVLDIVDHKKYNKKFRYE